MVGLIIALSIVGLLLIIIFICSIKIVRQTQKIIVERMGGYHKTWDVGIHMLVPFIDRVAYRISMKEQIKDFAPQDVITKDTFLFPQADKPISITITSESEIIFFFIFFPPRISGASAGGHTAHLVTILNSISFAA